MDDQPGRNVTPRARRVLILKINRLLHPYRMPHGFCILCTFLFDGIRLLILVANVYMPEHGTPDLFPMENTVKHTCDKIECCDWFPFIIYQKLDRGGLPLSDTLP
jgi:hypothetical protein